ncbi:MAG TPA: peptide-methionine (R)-S-oxide reductase MsrB, partial [Prolixibacteraceae bacterium]|nr:peptide-methionine (R)-S-oxide reductase MsrB [Prolixibacteraceae bacterium]
MNRKTFSQTFLLLFGLTLFVSSHGFAKDLNSPRDGMETGVKQNTISKMNSSSGKKTENPYYSRTDQKKLNIPDSEWKRVLPPDLYEVARNKATERSFTGKYWDFTGKGTYYCAACGFRLFRSDAKFASECGWPSFYEQIDPKSVIFHEDHSYGMNRTEALCGRCGSHLGHLFDDGPKP